jgi:hypothetical protein
MSAVLASLLNRLVLIAFVYATLLPSWSWAVKDIVTSVDSSYAEQTETIAHEINPQGQLDSIKQEIDFPDLKKEEAEWRSRSAPQCNKINHTPVFMNAEEQSALEHKLFYDFFKELVSLLPEDEVSTDTIAFAKPTPRDHINKFINGGGLLHFIAAGVQYLAFSFPRIEKYFEICDLFSHSRIRHSYNSFSWPFGDSFVAVKF